MKNKNLNLALGLSLLALNSSVPLISIFALIGLYLINTYTKDLGDVSLSYKIALLGSLTIMKIILSFLDANLLLHIVSILFMILSIVITFMITMNLIEDLIFLTVTTDDSKLRTSLRTSLFYLTAVDIIVLIFAIINVLAVTTNIEMFFNLANSLNKESTLYAVTYLPVIIKYFISKPYRNVYLEIKESEVIE